MEDARITVIELVTKLHCNWCNFSRSELDIYLPSFLLLFIRGKVPEQCTDADVLPFNVLT